MGLYFTEVQTSQLLQWHSCRTIDGHQFTINSNKFQFNEFGHPYCNRLEGIVFQKARFDQLYGILYRKHYFVIGKLLLTGVFENIIDITSRNILISR